MISLEYRHVDVFSQRPFRGNGLVVVLGDAGLSTETMQALTREVRQFESAFLTEIDLAGRSAALRIFTEDEELDFAGHPVLGAAAVLHGMLPSRSRQRDQQWTVRVGLRGIEVRTRPGQDWIDVEMDQGPPRFGPAVTGESAASIGEALGLSPEQLHPALPMQVVSTGLAYVIVPVTGGLERARIEHHDFAALLRLVGARFVYVLDPQRAEGRTWDNAGRVEDVATGSAAGPAAGYLMRHGVRPAGEPLVIAQGQYVGRPSTMRVRPDLDGRLWVGGPVAPVAAGRFTARTA